MFSSTYSRTERRRGSRPKARTTECLYYSGHIFNASLIIYISLSLSLFLSPCLLSVSPRVRFPSVCVYTRVTVTSLPQTYEHCRRRLRMFFVSLSLFLSLSPFPFYSLLLSLSFPPRSYTFAFARIFESPAVFTIDSTSTVLGDARQIVNM